MRLQSGIALSCKLIPAVHQAVHEGFYTSVRMAGQKTGLKEYRQEFCGVCKLPAGHGRYPGLSRSLSQWQSPKDKNHLLLIRY